MTLQELIEIEVRRPAAKAEKAQKPYIETFMQ